MNREIHALFSIYHLIFPIYPLGNYTMCPGSLAFYVEMYSSEKEINPSYCVTATCILNSVAIFTFHYVYSSNYSICSKNNFSLYTKTYLSVLHLYTRSYYVTVICIRNLVAMFIIFLIHAKSNYTTCPRNFECNTKDVCGYHAFVDVLLYQCNPCSQLSRLIGLS